MLRMDEGNKMKRTMKMEVKRLGHILRMDEGNKVKQMMKMEVRGTWTHSEVG